MYQIVANEQDTDWEPTGLPGVSIKCLSGDPDTGASVALYKFEPGCTVQAHWHSRADETGYILSGDFIEDGTVLGAGAILHGTSGTVHGPHHTKTGCIGLFVLSSKIDFNAVEAPVLSDQ